MGDQTPSGAFNDFANDLLTPSIQFPPIHACEPVLTPSAQSHVHSFEACNGNDMEVDHSNYLNFDIGRPEVPSPVVHNPVQEAVQGKQFYRFTALQFTRLLLFLNYLAHVPNAAAKFKA